MSVKFLVTKFSCSFNGRNLPSGAIIMRDEDLQVDYICTRFPKYFGERTPLLSLLVYDYEWQQWEDSILDDGDIASKIWAFYASHFKIGATTLRGKSAMKHSRRHKGSGSGQRLTPYTDASITDYSCSNKYPYTEKRRYAGI